MDYIIGSNKYRVIVNYKKVKRIFFKITKFKEIMITTPIKLSEEEVLKMLNKHQKWLQKQLLKEDEIILKQNEVLIFGKVYQLQEDITLKNDYAIDGNTIYYHQNLNKLMKDALGKVSAMFYETSKNFNLSFIPILQFRKMKSRWGVCHYYKEKVVLNKVLIHLPFELINYVINHELTHFYHPNHGQDFYKCLETHIKNHRELKKTLKKYQFLL